LGESEAGRTPTARPPDAVARHEVLSSGIACGLGAGVAMLLLAMISAALQDVSIWRPLEALGETFVGPQALPGTAAKILFGLLVHAATSAALGITFAAIAPRDMTLASGMGVGLGFSLVSVALMMMTVVPWVNPGFRQGIAVIGGTWVIAIALFGVLVGLAPALRRRLSQGATARGAPERARSGGVPVAPRPRTA
jgi:hypothetical protein